MEQDFGSGSRLIAGPKEGPLTFRSQTWLHDIRLRKGQEISLPNVPVLGVSRILYVFEGRAKIANVELESGESVIINDDVAHTLKSEQDTDLVLFTTDPKADFFREGMFSGNIR
ncbi:pirin family protein [Pseudomonas cerasi]